MNKWDISPTLLQDLQFLAKHIPRELYHKTVFITGGTGLIGSLLIHAFQYANDFFNADITTIAFVRSLDKAKQLFFAYENSLNFHLCHGDIRTKIICDFPIDYIIHGASITSSKEFILHPVETIITAVDGTKNILHLAQEKNISSLLYISSMEVFGISNSIYKKKTEKDLGYIDISNIRSSYSESKRLCECLCVSFASEYGVPVKIARLAQVFGAGISESDTRIFAQFAKSVISAQPIILHTDGTSWGNYCYTQDALLALFYILTIGQIGEAYNVVNESTAMQIKEMANLVANKIANGNIKIIYDIPTNPVVYGYAPITKLRLSSQKLESLGWKPSISLEDAYKRTIQYMREIKSKED